jgi:phospholipase/lecithinase/hemolysin
MPRWYRMARPSPVSTRGRLKYSKANGSTPRATGQNGTLNVLSPAARQTIGTHISAFNAAIRSAAEAHDWIYIDVNTLIESELSDPNRIRKCQSLIAATTMDDFRAALASSCPAEAAPNFFGELLSFDGIHPSVSGHQLVADAIAAALREKHGDIF